MARRNAGLDAAQLEGLAQKLKDGGRPRVRLSGPQFPADTVGTVVRIGDPQVDGEEFVTVRTRVGGVIDDLAFSPSELTTTATPPVKAATKAVKAKAPRAKAAPRPVPAGSEPNSAGPPTAPPVGGATPAPAAPATTAPPPGGTPAAGPAPTKAARKAAAPRRSSPVTPVRISIISAGASWSVSVERGARSLVKSTPITPGAVTAIAALLGDEAVSSAIASVNDAARSEAEERAEQLRAELAQVQAILDSHQAP